MKMIIFKCSENPQNMLIGWFIGWNQNALTDGSNKMTQLAAPQSMCKVATQGNGPTWVQISWKKYEMDPWEYP